MSCIALLRVIFPALVLWPTLYAQEETPQLDGYVTRVGTAEDFDVNGKRVHCQSSAQAGLVEKEAVSGECRKHAFGEHLFIYGKRDKKTDVIAATKIESPGKIAGHAISGFAVVDKVLSPALLRADGFVIEVNANTQEEWAAPLTAANGPATNEWVQYEGKRDSRGVVVASRLVFYPPALSAKEDKLRRKNEFDPAAVSEDDRQSGASKFFKGVDYKRLPAVHDAAQQERVDRIGKQLIPAYQKALANDDPNKLNFRFQLVDTPSPGCIALPSGIILIPTGLASKVNDAELAVVLAGSMSVALEKQMYRYLPAGQAKTASSIAGAAAGIFVPGLGLATDLGTGIASSSMQRRLQEQAGRVSLTLLRDAGYDVQEAPLTWWKLSTKKDDFMQKRPPAISAYLFEFLATAGNSPSPLLETESH